MDIKIKTQDIVISGYLHDDVDESINIMKCLPLESLVQRWGDEVFFKIPYKCSKHNATTHVSVGDIAFAHKGNCLCLFCGKTPISINENPMPSSEVVIIGKMTGDFSLLKLVPEEAIIIVEKSC